MITEYTIKQNAKFKITGIRPGEKIHEQMIGSDEAMNTAEHKDHYEILANGSIPLFIKLDDCPNRTLASLPKEKLLKFYNLYSNILSYYNPLKIYKKRFRDISKFYYYGKNFFKKIPSADSFIKKNQEINQIRSYLLEYTKNNLTSEKLAEYVINTSNIFFK